MLESSEGNDALTVEYGPQRSPVKYEPNDIFSKGASEFNLPPSVVDRLEKRFVGIEGAGTRAKHEEGQTINGYSLFDVAEPAYNMEYLSKIYETDYTHYAAVNAKVANVVGLGYGFVESQKTIEKEDKIDDDSEKMEQFRRKLSRAQRGMFDYLDSLNEEEEFIETIQKVVIDYETVGNGYLEVGRTAFGTIGYIGHIPAHTLRVRRRRDGFVQFAGDKPVFFRKFGDSNTSAPFGNSDVNELIHFKKYTPLDAYYGAPDIIAALPAVAGNKFADEYNLDFFENKAVPRNIILVRGGKFDHAAQAKLLRFFSEDLRGSHHRALFVPLPADTRELKHDLEVRSVETGVQDSAFREYSKGNIEKILMVHRVPPSKLGMTGDAALAAAKDLDKTFREQVCRPLQRVIEKKVNRVIKEMTDMFEFKLNELDLIDEVAQASIDQAYFGIGARTANEIRAREGRTGLEGGDRTIWDINEEDAEDESERKSQVTASRTRDQQRVTARTDSVGAARNAKGEGRSYE